GGTPTPCALPVPPSALLHHADTPCAAAVRPSAAALPRQQLCRDGFVVSAPRVIRGRLQRRFRYPYPLARLCGNLREPARLGDRPRAPPERAGRPGGGWRASTYAA